MRKYNFAYFHIKNSSIAAYSNEDDDSVNGCVLHTKRIKKNRRVDEEKKM